MSVDTCSLQKVALISMPWMAVEFPSIQLSTAAATLRKVGIECDVHELFVDYAAEIGVNLYTLLSNSGGFNEEWIFADCYFEAEAGIRLEAFLECFPSFGLATRDAEAITLRALRLVTRDFLTRMLEEMSWEQYDIVGFSLTIAQTAASMAMARLLKKRHPRLRVIAGGTSCAGSMGPALLRICPYIDVAVQAEAEAVLVDLVGALRANDPLDSLPGIVRRLPGGAVVVNEKARLVSFAGDPLELRYEPYFERIERLGLVSKITPWLPFESSRGCWYGEKNQCTFCGLHEIMRYRSRSFSAVLKELEAHEARYDVNRFFSVDLIMPMAYYDDFLPEIIRRGHDWLLFYEIKANVKRSHVELLARAGVRWIQPGIESLHDVSLQLMRKGVTAIHNVQLLKWCEELGIRITWNMILGIPGETDAIYGEMAIRMPRLFGLQPPSGVSPFQLHRFSPFFEMPETFGIRRLGANRLYALIYPVPQQDLDDLAYSHDYELDGKKFPDGTQLKRVISQWQEAYSRGAALTIRDNPDGTAHLIDARGPRETMIHLDASEAALYRRLDAAVPDSSLADNFAAADPANARRLDGGSKLERLLQSWDEMGLLMRDSGRSLALAVRRRHDALQNTAPVQRLRHIDSRAAA